MILHKLLTYAKQNSEKYLMLVESHTAAYFQQFPIHQFL